MTLETLQTPDLLVKYKIWPEIKGWEELQEMPRYFPGRNILVKTTVNNLTRSPDYQSFDPRQSQKYVTHNAVLEGISPDKKHFTVSVRGASDLIKVPVEETLQLNQPHIFAKDVNGDIVLEDSLLFGVKSHSAKAKLLEMAIKLAPLVEELDFRGDADAIYDVQIRAIKVIRSCCDFIANNVGTEKIMHPDRATTGTVGRISLKGQGNCHGCSSVIGSYLYHFAPLLGLDVKYRSGYSFSSTRK